MQGLRRIGELQYDAQETRRSTLYALTTEDGNLQVEYADQSREADHRVSEGIAEYLVQARRPRDIEVGKRLANEDRKSTRLNSSHRCISYAVFCLKKKKK